MTDVVDQETRSKMMSGIKGKNTKPELIVRKALHKRGFRYKLHDKNLPGKPDLVFPKYKAIIMINGCFWHGHDCHLFKWPSTRKEFWQNKILRNKEKDTENMEALLALGWRVLTIWECSIKGRTRQPIENVIDQIHKWISFGKESEEIKGKE